MQWEYLVVETTMDAGALGKLGADGWELVPVVSPGIHPRRFRAVHNRRRRYGPA
jgi:hypothetical protein